MADQVEYDVGSATSSDMQSAVEEVTIDQRSTEGAEATETYYQCSKWPQWYGYYRSIPELKQAIDTRAIWTVGKGYEAKPRARAILSLIHGWGEDTFNDILKNMIITKRICGDAFAEIIRDKKTGILLNLKPLDPSTIRIVVNKKGIHQRYEQVSKTTKQVIKFPPHKIFHLLNKRVADEIHGIGDI